jgi:hypothetical protein
LASKSSHARQPHQPAGAPPTTIAAHPAGRPAKSQTRACPQSPLHRPGLAFSYVSALSSNRATKRSTFFVVSMPAAHVLRVILMASVDLECLGRGTHGRKRHGHTGRTEAEDNSGCKHCPSQGDLPPLRFVVLDYTCAQARALHRPLHRGRMRFEKTLYYQ